MEGETEPLRSAAAQWSLAGDKQLLGVLQNIHERLVSRCQETNKRLGEMAAALDDATVDLHNVNNKFMALSNTQFIESRVYDDDDEVTAPPDTTKEPKKPMDATSEIEKIKLGLKVLESMHEPLHILYDTDSESDTEDDGISRMVLKPKDPYAHRPLPYIIGSYAWQNKWHAGLLPEDSDTDTEKRSTKEDSREEYSDSEPESTGNIQTDKLHVPERTVSTASSDLISEELPSSSPAVKPSPSDIAAELARRLGGHGVKTSEPEMEYTPPNPTIRKVYKPEKPATSTIFSDEPPPLENSYSDKDEYSQEEDDDIFAELNKKKPYAQNDRVQSRVTEDLFGGLGRNDARKDDGDIFSDFKEPPKVANQKTTLFSDESEAELFVDKSQPKPQQDVSQEAIHVKKPVGGISLFGNKGTESIGAAILKRNQKQSSTEEDSTSEETPSHKQETKKEKDIFNDLFAKSEKEQRKVEKKVEKLEKEPVKEVKKEKKVDLFSDNIFDDIDDIFTSNIPKIPIKEPSKNQKSIFDDDDDLFSDVAVTKNTKVEVKTSSHIKKSIFDSDDELFSENKKIDIKPLESQKTIKTVPNVNVGETSKSIFDDNSDNDIFSNVKESVGTCTLPKDKLEEDLVRSKGIERVTEKIPDNSIVENKISPEEKIPTKAEITGKTTIFDDNDDDIFKTTLSTNAQRSISIVDEIPAKQIFDNVETKSDETKKMKEKPIFDDELQDDLFNNYSKGDTTNRDKAKITKSLFNNDSEDELFSSKSKEKNNSEIIQSEPKATDEAGDNVIQNTNTTHHNTVNITVVSQNTKIVNTISSKEDNLFPNPDENNQKSNKEDVRNVVNEEEIDDLFTNSKMIKTVTDISKEETDSFVNEDNNDEWEDDLFKSNTTQQTHVNPPSIKIKSTLEKEIREDLFTNISHNNKQKKITVVNSNETLNETSNILEKESLITQKVESDIIKRDNTNDNNIDAPQDTLFSDEANIDINKPPVFTEKNVQSFNKSDIFSEILSEPPEFEKPKEPKKSKNINALFDDDSDDEALFFKKNDPTLDDKPEYSSPTSENRLFGLFHDEPPALDIDFVQKTSKTHLDDVPKDQVDFNNDVTKSEILEKGPQTPVSPKSENEFFIESKTELPVVEKVFDKSNDTKKESSKPIGKLKTMNFNINVNALLPGASPKKNKAVEQIKEPAHAKSEADIRIKESSEQEIEPKVVKSISFEGKPESDVLDNTLSKERAKIQVKRRPSTRRARKEAVRKSAIDFGEDSTDHSSSIDDTSKTDKSENDLNSAMDTENAASSLNYDSIVDVEDLKPDIVPTDSNIIEKPKSEIESKVPEVKTKTVYILNDEDIFDIEPKSDTKQTLNSTVVTIVDDDLFKSKLDPSKAKDTSKLGTNEGLPETAKNDLEFENGTKNFNADKTLFTNTSKHLNIIDDDDDLFKVKANTSINTLGKVYKESESVHAEDDSLFKSQQTHTSDNLDKSTDNMKETKSIANELIKPKAEETKYKIEATAKISDTIDKPKEAKKVSIFDLSDDENELFNTNSKSVKSNVFTTDSDDQLFNTKGEAVKKESKDIERDVKVKVDVKASLFGDDDDDDLFAVKTKKREDTASQFTRSTIREMATTTTEPVFEDPLSLFGGEED